MYKLVCRARNLTLHRGLLFAHFGCRNFPHEAQFMLGFITVKTRM